MANVWLTSLARFTLFPLPPHSQTQTHSRRAQAQSSSLLHKVSYISGATTDDGWPTSKRAKKSTKSALVDYIEIIREKFERDGDQTRAAQRGKRFQTINRTAEWVIKYSAPRFIFTLKKSWTYLTKLYISESVIGLILIAYKMSYFYRIFKHNCLFSKRSLSFMKACMQIIFFV